MTRFEFVESLTDWRAGVAGRVVEIDQSELGAKPWGVVPQPAVQQVFARVEESTEQTLSDVAEIFVGIQTSGDPLYFVQETPDSTDAVVVFIEPQGNEARVEREITRLAIRDRVLEPYGASPEPDALVIWPYEILPAAGGATRAQVIQPADLRKRFPLAADYLERHRVALESRSVSPDPGEAFYAFGRTQSLTKMDEPKIVVRVLSLPHNPQYVLDPDGLVVPGGGSGPYGLIRTRDTSEFPHEYLIAVLSHPVIDGLVTRSARVFRGGYLAHSRQTLSTVPVPQATESERNAICDMIGELHDLATRARRETDAVIQDSIGSRRGVLRSQIEDRISELLGLSEDELRLFDR